MMIAVGNGISPVISKGGAGVGDVLLYDSFVGNNGALIDGRVPPVGANAWVDESSANTIQNNVMACSGNHAATYDLGEAPVNFMAFFTVIVDPVATVYQSVRIRYSNENNHIGLAVNPQSGNIEFYSLNAGVTQFLLSTAYDATGVTHYYVRIVAVGTTVTAYVQSVNDSIILTGTAHAALTSNQLVCTLTLFADGGMFDDIIVITT